MELAEKIHHAFEELISERLLAVAIIGGALCTPAMGYIAEITGSMAIAMIVPLLAYLYILYFSHYCSKTDV